MRSPPIGDSLIALGALKAVAESQPGARIDIVGARELAEVADGLGFVGRVIAVDRADKWTYYRAAMRLLREASYDIVIDGYTGTGPIGLSRALVIAASRAPVRIGGATGVSRRILTHPVDLSGPFDHMVTNAYALVAPLVPPTVEHRGAEFHLLAAERAAAEDRWNAVPGRAPRVVVNIAAGHVTRAWPLLHYERVISRLRAERPHCRIAIIGQGREDEAESLAKVFDAVVMTTTFRAMMALVATSDLVISPDTSVIHVAAAFERTVLSIHPAQKERWRPWRTRGRAVFGSTGLTLHSVPVPEVLGALDDLLATEPELRP